MLEEPRRYLPNGDVARGVIGRTDVDGVGTGGVELQYNSVLTGTSGQLRREFGSKGRSMPSGVKALIEAIPGHDVKLTKKPTGAKFTYVDDTGKKVTRSTFQSPPFAAGPASYKVTGFTPTWGPSRSHAPFLDSSGSMFSATNLTA